MGASDKFSAGFAWEVPGRWPKITMTVYADGGVSFVECGRPGALGFGSESIAAVAVAEMAGELGWLDPVAKIKSGKGK